MAALWLLNVIIFFSFFQVSKKTEMLFCSVIDHARNWNGGSIIRCVICFFGTASIHRGLFFFSAREFYNTAHVT